MNDKPKTPGAMVLMPRILAEKMLDGSASMGWSMAEDLRAVLAALSEQPPAVGGSIAERIRAATIADSGQEGVNIAEGRFGRAMAALCLQLDGEVPAVDGEPEDETESFAYKLEFLGKIDRCDVACGSYGDKFHRWDDAGPYVEYEDHLKHIDVYKAEVERLSAHVAPLLARIAKLEAQQGEPVAYQAESGMIISKGVRNRGVESGADWVTYYVHPLYRQAQPATAKVVLPERMEVYSAVDTGWNSCLDEIAKLNP